jgi:PAS domain S-box-containing protein
MTEIEPSSRFRRFGAAGSGCPGGARFETTLVLGALVVAFAFDHLIGDRVGVAVGFATVVSLLLRRPDLLVPGLLVAFFADTAGALGDGAGLLAPVWAGGDTAAAAAVFVAARRVGVVGQRVRSARALIEVLMVVGVAAPLAGAGLALAIAGTPLAALADLVRLADWPRGMLGAAVVAPSLLLVGRDVLSEPPRGRDIVVFLSSAVAMAACIWLAVRSFPFPFVVICVPLLVVAAHLSPLAVATIAAGATLQMVLMDPVFHATRPEAGHGAITLAAALTGLLPIALCLLLAELKSERHRLADTGKRLRQVLAGVAGHGFCALDRDGAVASWNDKIAGITGFAAEEVIGRSFALLFPQEAAGEGRAQGALDEAARLGRVEAIGWCNRRDGRRFWAQVVIEAVVDGQERVVGFTASIQDQSALQRSESARLAAERRFGFALGSGGQGIWELDLVERRMHYSDVYAAMLGLAPSDLGEDPAAWKARVHPDDVAKIPPDEAGDDAGETELRLGHADGHWIWVCDRRRIAERDDAGRPLRVIGSHADITARKLAEEKFRLAVEALPNGLLIADTAGRITFVNGEIERMFGHAPGTLVGRMIDDLVPAAQRGGHAERRAAFFAAPSARRMGAGRDLDGQRADGTRFPVEIGLNPVATTEGTQILCVVTDITARKLAEEKFRLAVEASPNGVLIADAEGRITLVNSETERMFGYEPGTLHGRSIDALVPEEAFGEHARRRRSFNSNPAVRRMGAGRSLNGRRRDGSLFPVEIGLNPIVTAEGRSVLCVVTDITARKQVEAELAMSEARHRMMADHFVDLVVHLDLDLNRTWVSPACRDILGVAPEALLGRTPTGLVHPDDAEIVQATLKAVAEGLERGSYCVRYRHAAGHWIWLEVSLRLIRGADEAPVGILAVGRDVTRTRAAEEALKASEATFRGAMEGASIGMALEQLDGGWVSVNRALCRILGMEEADLLRLGPAAFTHPLDTGIDAEQRRRLLAGEIASYQVEKRWRNRGGGVVWTHQSISLDKGPDGAPRRLILQIQDVTERRQIEQMKSEFVSMVSHELRTPLTSIRGALGLVLGTMSGELPRRAVHLVDIAHKNSERLIPLVNDILDLDKIDAGMIRVDLTEVDAVPLVGQAIEATRAFCDRYGVAVAVDMPAGPIVLRVDEGRFLQTLTNLLSNAAKFSPRDAVVDVTARVADGRVRIAVRDRGPGIPDEFRAKIFGRFAQADSATTRAKGGSGLGLHICRQLVNLMGGTIDFESTVGVGSTFWVEFPASVPAAPAMLEPRPTEAVAPARRRIAFLAADAAAEEFLATAIEQARFEPSREPTAETIAVLIEATAGEGPAAAALAARLDALGPARPPVVVIAIGCGEAVAARAAAAWGASDTWVVEAGAPHRLVARIAALADGERDDLPSILHVEDDLDLAAVVAAGLAGRATVVCVARIALAVQALEARRFDLVVIDPSLPDGDGLTRLVPRLEQSGIPYMVLSAEERSEPAATAVARLVKSRIGDRQLVETIVSILSERDSKQEVVRHAR